MRAFFRLCLKVLSEPSGFNSSFMLFQIFTPLYPKVLFLTYLFKRGIVVLQKRAVSLITFANQDAYSESLFKQLIILKLTDLVNYQYHYDMPSKSLNLCFCKVTSIYSYNTRLALKLLH